MEKASVASALRTGLHGHFDLVLNEPLPEALADLVRRLPTSEPRRAQGPPKGTSQGAERERDR
jgi:hypothetical protein